MGAPSKRGILGLGKIVDASAAASLLADVLGSPDAVQTAAGKFRIRGPRGSAELDLDALQGVLFGGPDLRDEVRGLLQGLGFDRVRLPLEPFAFGLDSI